jgi:hypothetical protein
MPHATAGPQVSSNRPFTPFSKLKAWHEYLHRERDPEEEGLVYIRTRALCSRSTK